MAAYSTTRVYPLIVVLGATGCGKSKLALELACKFHGEVINADAMQMYKGLDIITNKVTEEERALAKHHLLDFVDPPKNFTVSDFTNTVIPLMDNLFENGKLPVIVGGTHYYIEAVLWDLLFRTSDGQSVSDSSSDSDDVPLDEAQLTSLPDLMAHRITRRTLSNISGPVLHGFLKGVDPARADCLHPNDRRKIIRSLQVYQQTGIPHSQHLVEQHKSSGGCSISGPLRFPNAFMLWVQCEQNALNKRLDERVDEMISRGLLQEISQFHQKFVKKTQPDLPANISHGIFQSIGFKEFQKFLALPDEVKESVVGKETLQECINSMKTVTQRYSKRQIKWIRGRFLRRANRQIPPIYGFNATDVSDWNTNVRDPAFRVVETILKGGVPDENHIPITENNEHCNKTFYCDICNRPIVGSLQWEKHLQSRSHYKLKKKQSKQSTEYVIR